MGFLDKLFGKKKREKELESQQAEEEVNKQQTRNDDSQHKWCRDKIKKKTQF